MLRRRSKKRNETDPSRIHYLRIGKTAGNQIKAICSKMELENPGLKFSTHGHAFRLDKLSPGTKYFFSIRHPVSRFYSGFYERKRQGRDGGNLWSRDEALSFNSFAHAVELAEEIFESSDRGRLARSAMNSIEHVRNPQASWFIPFGFFLSEWPPVWIIRQERFDEDIDVFARRLGLEKAPSFRATDEVAKVTRYEEIPALSERAETNLREWFAADIRFYEDCSSWLDDQARTK